MVTRRYSSGFAGLWLIHCLVALAMLLQPVIENSHGEVLSHEPQIKAVFLYNFTQFTDWPPDAFADADAPLVIGILGKDPFGDCLEDAVRGEQINHHAMLIQHFKRIEDVKNCHLLFIADSEAKRLTVILAKLEGRSVLTVGDTENFASQGGMVRFEMVNNHIQFQINLDALKAAHLTMSSKLLRAAEIVSTKKK